MHRVLVTGGRKYADKAKLWLFLDNYHANKPIDLLVQGGAPGTDTLAYLWAIDRCVPVLTHPANWDRDGKYSAGPIRNRAMAKTWKPHSVIATEGGTGTAGMIKIAKGLNIPVIQVI